MVGQKYFMTFKALPERQPLRAVRPTATRIKHCARARYATQSII